MDSSKVIKEILLRLRNGADMDAILQYVGQTLTKEFDASRCVIWTVVGDQLECTKEYSSNSCFCFDGISLSSQESMSIVLEFLSRFADEKELGIISIFDIWQDTSMHESSERLTSNLKLADVRSRLLGQLRSRGIFSGYIDLQQSGRTREWTPEECTAFGEVALVLSVVVQQIFDVRKIACDAADWKTMYELTCLFGNTKDSKLAWRQACELMAVHMGFEFSQVFLKENHGDAIFLVPQLDDKGSETLSVEETKNPFVSVFLSGRGKIVNVNNEKNSSKDPYFGRETALMLPLHVDEQQLGVVALWQRRPDARRFIPQDRELGLMLAQLFAMYAKTNAS